MDGWLYMGFIWMNIWMSRVANGYVIVICVNVREYVSKWLGEYKINEWKYARSVCVREIEDMMFESITH